MLVLRVNEKECVLKKRERKGWYCDKIVGDRKLLITLYRFRGKAVAT